MCSRRILVLVASLFKKCATHGVTSLVRWGWFWPAVAMLRVEHLFSIKNRRRSCLLDLLSVDQGVSRLAAQSNVVLEQRSLALKPVRCIGLDGKQEAIYRRAHLVELPECSITLFRDVKIIGGTEILCANGALLYDELAKGDPDRYGCKAFGIIPTQGFGMHLPACKNGRVLISHLLPERAHIARGVHLCKDYSGNYFHWLFECLPRAIVALRQTDYAQFPLLVDDRLPRQNLQALEMISADREIISVGPKEIQPVGELVFPGVFSFMRDNYGNDPAASDLLIAPEVVKLLRETYLSAPITKGHKRLFVARDRARYRRLLNEEEIHRKVMSLGFEIVHPEDLGFSDQVVLFSEAAMIVGPTGAGLSNMVFAPEGCKVVVLAGATRGANYFIFGQLAQWLNHELAYVCGAARQPAKSHSDYVIDVDVLGSVLAEGGISASVSLGNQSA